MHFKSKKNWFFFDTPFTECIDLLGKLRLGRKGKGWYFAVDCNRCTCNCYKGEPQCACSEMECVESWDLFKENNYVSNNSSSSHKAFKS